LATNKPQREDQRGEFVCHVHKDKDGEPFYTTSSKAFNEHIMTEHVDGFWKGLKEAGKMVKLMEQGKLSKRGKFEK